MGNSRTVVKSPQFGEALLALPDSKIALVASNVVSSSRLLRKGLLQKRHTLHPLPLLQPPGILALSAIQGSIGHKELLANSRGITRQGENTTSIYHARVQSNNGTKMLKRLPIGDCTN